MPKNLKSRTGDFWVYMLQCDDGTLYTGYTNNLNNRIRLHNTGNGAKYVRGRIPVRLAYCKAYRYYKNAVKAEAHLKRLTRRCKLDLVKAYRAKGVSR